MIKRFVLLLLIIVIRNQCYSQATARQTLMQSKIALGLTKFPNKIFHFYYNEVSLGREQSDRSYAPFFTTATNAEAWYYPEINATRIVRNGIRIGSGPDAPTELFRGPQKSYLVRDTTYIPLPNDYDLHNALAVITDWADDVHIKQVKNETYRDYDRLVFERSDSVRTERLFIDPKTSFPVKIEYDVLHSLLGQQHIEFVYSNWLFIDGIFYPGSSFKLEDGEPMQYRTIGKSDFANTTQLFSRYVKMPLNGKINLNPEWYVSEQPSLVKVSDETYLSVNKMYTETFTKIGDTVYLLDATISEERARQDEKLIKDTFPGYTKIVVVVTDVAWPHIGSVRYWVSKGATIISHGASRSFLEKIVSRVWKYKPDELQKHPHKLNLITVNKRTSFAGGDLVVFPIDGIGSEGALACFSTRDKYLWASDYIQTTKRPAAYSKEVINAVKREKIEPVKVAAEHIALTDWQQILQVNQ